MANPTKNLLNKLGIRQKAVLIFASLGLIIGVASNFSLQRAMKPILEDTIPTVQEGEEILRMVQQLQYESASYLATGDEIHRTRFNNTEAYINIKLKVYADFLGDDPGEEEALESFSNIIKEISTANKNIIESHSRTLEFLEELDSLEDPINTITKAAQEVANNEVLRNIQEEDFQELEEDALLTKDLLAIFSVAMQSLQREVNEFVVLSKDETLEEFEETLETIDQVAENLSLTLEEDEVGEASVLENVIGIKELVEPLAIEIINSHKETLTFIRSSNSLAEGIESESAKIEDVIDEEISNAQRISRNSILLSFGTGLLVAFLGYLIANTFLVSILDLVNTSKKITEGDLASRAEVKSQDEIGTLVSAFNEMADRTQNVLDGLEEQVSERTREFQELSIQDQKRTSQLEAISDVANSVASLQGIEQLLPHITETISERFGFYHTGIFLLSKDNKYAVLRAASSEGGQSMLARNHQLRIGQEGVVGFVIAQKEARIALDVGEDLVYFDNPDLPSTHSEMALPLIIRDEVIGALDIQSEERGAFTEDDIKGLTTLAAQVAIAIQNARLFRQSEEALEELDSSFQQYISNEWKHFSKTSSTKGYRANQEGLEPIKESLQKNSKVKKDASIHQVPIKLRDVIIGHLNINLDKPVKEFTEDELDIIQSTVDRFALAIENARLLETTSRRAGRERLVSDITTKIRSTNDPQEMIQTALDELKNALGAAKVQLASKSPEQN
ncbi:MAG: GAF domain-containing protein [Chloroflexi bacterium]|nr:GAF domain-containing protein [Chloroflexota bacterium]